MDRAVYYLPGYGGRLSTGLGEGLMNREWDIAGRETVGNFKEFPFQQQVEVVMEDLRQHFWRDDAFVVANSFGAYLFLHAQAQMEPYIGNVLLLSPIIGEFSNEQSGMNFLPPYPNRLKELVAAGLFKTPLKCEIHVGELDWQSRPADVEEFGRQVGVHVTVVPGAGHMLGKEYVGSVLDCWLGKPE